MVSYLYKYIATHYSMFHYLFSFDKHNYCLIFLNFHLLYQIFLMTFYLLIIFFYLKLKIF